MESGTIRATTILGVRCGGGVAIGGDGQVTLNNMVMKGRAKKIRTLETTGIPEVPSPICDDNYVYFVKNGGVITCLDLKTGKRVYRIRTKGRGTHYASPLIADGKLFTVAGNGRITVMTLGPNPEILATNDMGGPVYATPAIVDGCLYVRTHTDLFAFQKVLSPGSQTES